MRDEVDRATDSCVNEPLPPPEEARPLDLSSEWAGDYVAAGVTAISMEARNLGEFDLDLRLAFGTAMAPSGPKSAWITSPAATDTVKVHYRGTFPDGKEFDASAKHGGPATFPLNGVIPISGAKNASVDLLKLSLLLTPSSVMLIVTPGSPLIVELRLPPPTVETPGSAVTKSSAETLRRNSYRIVDRSEHADQ